MRSLVGFRHDLLLRLLGAMGAAACGSRTGIADLQATPSRTAGDARGPTLDASGVDATVPPPVDAGTGRDASSCAITGPTLDGGDATAPHSHCFTPLVDQTDAGPCPSPADLLNGAYSGELCNQAEVTKVLCGPVLEGTRCCYELEQAGLAVGCYVGRAFLVDEGLVKSALVRAQGWHAGTRPRVDGLTVATRRALADGWVLDGLFEHASVASFARLSMQLLAAGAPANLLRDTHAAALDEVHHAELCFALASTYAGEALAPSALPVPDSVPIARSLEDIVAESVVEGCIGETLAAAQAAESLLYATDAAVVAALDKTLEDEIRHAELAWRIVRWAIDVGGERVRRKVAQSFASFVPPPPPVRDLSGVDAEVFREHGRLTPDEARAVALRAIAEVVEPCSCALLAAGVPRSRDTRSGEDHRRRSSSVAS
jgi:hypothetical protein